MCSFILIILESLDICTYLDSILIVRKFSWRVFEMWVLRPPVPRCIRGMNKPRRNELRDLDSNMPKYFQTKIVLQFDLSAR